MPDASSLALFLAASLILFIVPGPAVLYIVARSIDQGWVAGIVSALGIALGSIGLVFATAFGISALVQAFPLAYDAIRYCGGAYLVYLGVRTWRSHDSGGMSAVRPPVSRRQVFSEAIVVNFLNPKTAIFFLAFLPQFVNPAAPIRLQLVVLGLAFVALGVVTDSVYAVLAGAIAERLRTSPGFHRWRRVTVSAVYVFLGIAAALLHPPGGA
ncbi:MAG TPA: LysE family translocator [Candidatus Krumholzibacteria bacterium]|nr:LysE family translocator [Candidatus Krumholzibacteria bacterium]